MDLILPTNQNTSVPVTLDTKVLVVIGANGAGKSSFGRNLHQRYAGQSVWISGMHSLFLSSEESKAPADGNELARLQSMIAERLFMPRMSEYEKLILHLQTEEFEAAVQYKEESKLAPDLLPPVTKIDRIQTIWEKMFPHNRLVRKSGFIELASTSIDGDSYTAGRMSDGEKLVFYLIGAVLCAPENALLIIEEPEVLLHDSIKNPLWDEIEAMRPDCTYVYLTHDIDFAASRDNSKTPLDTFLQWGCPDMGLRTDRKQRQFPGRGLYGNIRQPQTDPVYRRDRLQQHRQPPLSAYLSRLQSETDGRLPESNRNNKGIRPVERFPYAGLERDRRS